MAVAEFYTFVNAIIAIRNTTSLLTGEEASFQTSSSPSLISNVSTMNPQTGVLIDARKSVV